MKELVSRKKKNKLLETNGVEKIGSFGEGKLNWNLTLYYTPEKGKKKKKVK